MKKLIVCVSVLLLISCSIFAEEIKKPISNEIIVAVATNFREPIRAISEEFEKKTSHKVKLVFASSGQLFSQINHGAPYHLFLSADQIKPRELAKKNLAIADSQQTYAIGHLVLWANGKVLSSEGGKLLNPIDWNKLAIANPKFAPYGVAATEAIDNLERKQFIVNPGQHQLIKGESIAQAYQFVKSGSADHGLVALSLMRNQPETAYWKLPSELHSPIRQDLIRLNLAKDNPIVTLFMAYLLENEASYKVLSDYGYTRDMS
jgi:molybdate transport system substrate-binding protein